MEDPIRFVSGDLDPYRRDRLWLRMKAELDRNTTAAPLPRRLSELSRTRLEPAFALALSLCYLGWALAQVVTLLLH